jgi:hypothetical protein
MCLTRVQIDCTEHRSDPANVSSHSENKRANVRHILRGCCLYDRGKLASSACINLLLSLVLIVALALTCCRLRFFDAQVIPDGGSIGTWEKLQLDFAIHDEVKLKCSMTSRGVTIGSISWTLQQLLDVDSGTPSNTSKAGVKTVSYLGSTHTLLMHAIHLVCSTFVANDPEWLAFCFYFRYRYSATSYMIRNRRARLGLRTRSLVRTTRYM